MDTGNERTIEQLYRTAVSGLYSRLRSNYDFLYRKFGEEGLDLIEEMSREYGLSVAARAKLPDNDLASVSSFLLRIFDTVARGKFTVEKQEGMVVVKVESCPLGFTDPRMCRAHTAMEEAVVEALNPGLVYRIGRSIPAGDRCCEHIISEKVRS